MDKFRHHLEFRIFDISWRKFYKYIIAWVMRIKRLKYLLRFFNMDLVIGGHQNQTEIKLDFKWNVAEFPVRLPSSTTRCNMNIKNWKLSFSNKIWFISNHTVDTERSIVGIINTSVLLSYHSWSYGPWHSDWSAFFRSPFSLENLFCI